MEKKMIRLQKAIANKGISSRRAAETLIKEGKVKVNGTLVTTMGYLVNEDDLIEVEGLKEKEKKEKVAYLFYKPEKVMTTVHDDRNRKTVLDYFQNEPYRLFPAGRLDYLTIGALIITNDGELSHLLTHPSSHLEKTYEVKVRGTLSKDDIYQLENGILLEDGLTSPAKVKIIQNKEHSIFYLTIYEGRNRQIRRMCEAIHHPVLSLKRISIAFLTLDGLKVGSYRKLSQDEIELLKKNCIEKKKTNIIPNYKKKLK